MHTVSHHTPCSSARRSGAWQTLLGALRRNRPPRLDLETLPDYLKRDLGLLNGHQALRRDVLRD